MYTPVAKRQITKATGYTPVAKRTESSSSFDGLLTSFEAPITSEASAIKVQSFGDTLKTLGSGLKSFAQETLRQPASLGVEISRRLPGGQESLDPNKMPGVLKPISQALFSERPVPSLKQRIEDATPTFERFGFDKNSAKALSTIFIGGLTALDFTPFGGEKSVAKLLQATTKVDDAARILRTVGVAEDLVLPMAEKFSKISNKKTISTALNNYKELENASKLAKGVMDPSSSEGVGMVDEFIPNKPQIDNEEKLLQKIVEFPEDNAFINNDLTIPLSNINK